MNTSQPPTAPNLPAELPIVPLPGPVDLDIAVPGSKSLTNRYLLLSALADGETTLTGLLHSDDTHYMTEGLRALGFAVRPDWEAGACQIGGLGGEIPARGAELFVGAAGTAMRFLSAMVSLGHGRFRLDGTPRMRQRPIEDLLQGLRGAGVNARAEFSNGCPPVLVEADGLPGGTTRVDGSRSSQYVSALLQIAPYARTPLNVEIAGNFVSKPFVELTLKAMADFGVAVAVERERVFTPAHGGRYRARQHEIEGDATAASYFLAAAAILGGRCCVTNVRADSAQGDAHFADVLGRMGCRVRKGFLPGGKGIEVSRESGAGLAAVTVDLNDMPDVAQTLAAVCVFAAGTSRIVNVGNLRIKETDRLAALAAELKRAGAKVAEGPDWLEIAPGKPRPAQIETYDDHRMAMALALVGLGQPGITIKNPACVSKTYPRYFQDLARLN